MNTAATEGLCTVDDDVIVASENGQRPTLSARWSKDKVLSRWVSLIQECWHANWESRLPALRIRKTLEAMESALSAETSAPGDSKSHFI